MNRKFWKQKNVLDEPTDKVLEELRQHDPNSEEFATNLTHLERLTKLKASTKWKMKVSPDTIVTAGATLLGILIIVVYEQNHPMVSKGLNFKVPKSQ